jgi:hypothetical protein
LAVTRFYKFLLATWLNLFQGLLCAPGIVPLLFALKQNASAKCQVENLSFFADLEYHKV